MLFQLSHVVGKDPLLWLDFPQQMCRLPERKVGLDCFSIQDWTPTDFTRTIIRGCIERHYLCGGFTIFWVSIFPFDCFIKKISNCWFFSSYIAFKFVGHFLLFFFTQNNPHANWHYSFHWGRYKGMLQWWVIHGCFFPRRLCVVLGLWWRHIPKGSKHPDGFTWSNFMCAYCMLFVCTFIFIVSHIG